jgi:hypothetical protein
MTSLQTLCKQAAEQEAVVLRPEEPHWAGMVLGLASLAVGVWLSKGARVDVQAGAPMDMQAGIQAWGWWAMGGVLLSMLLHFSWKTLGPGWRLDFAQRRLSAVGHVAPEVVLDGQGWLVRTGPGKRFAHMAIDLMHDERGMVARLFEQGAFRRKQRQQMCAVADALALRLGAKRTGPRY